MNSETFHNPITARIAGFLEEIGIEVRRGELHEPTFLPGIGIDRGVLIVDESKMTYPGDLLHEAGHLAVVPPGRRGGMVMHAGDDAAEEMMAIAWSYAAALHLGIDVGVVFHEGGYKGGSSAIIENFGNRQYFGVPVLQWIGLTCEEKRAAELGVPPYPHMIRWLREEEGEERMEDRE